MLPKYYIGDIVSISIDKAMWTWSYWTWNGDKYLGSTKLKDVIGKPLQIESMFKQKGIWLYRLDMFLPAIPETWLQLEFSV